MCARAPLDDELDMTRWGWAGLVFVALGWSCSGSERIRLGGAGPSAGGSSAAGSGAGGDASGGASGTGGSAAGSAPQPAGGSLGALGTGAGGGAPIDPPALPLCGGQPCSQGEACCLATSRCFDPTADPSPCPPPPDELEQGKPCASNAHCAPNELCLGDSGLLCQQSGHCRPITGCGSCASSAPGGCRVCACDGTTYPDIQTACVARAQTKNVFGVGCGETFVPSDGAQTTFCGTDADCPTGQRCCAITGACYPPTDPGRCVQPPAGTRFPCTAHDQCTVGSEYCAGDGCSGPEGCAQLGNPGDECGVPFEPVCGCDGVTHANAACARMRGVRVAAPGECQR
jgi:hypothetical protein